MAGRKLSLLIIVLIVAAGIVLWVKRPRTSDQIEPPVQPAPPSAVTDQEAQLSQEAIATVPESSAPVEMELRRWEPAADAMTVVRVRAQKVLATVNGVPITLKDLAPVGEMEGDAEQVFALDDYNSRLQRAIETELTFQTAQAQGVGLTADQSNQLQQLRDGYAADIAEYKKQGLHWTSVTREQIEFEVRHTTALLLQQNLLTRAGGPTLDPTEAQIQQYHQQHAHDFGLLPGDPPKQQAAWLQIEYEIRRRLEPILRDNFARALRDYLDELKAGANITVHRPSPQ